MKNLKLAVWILILWLFQTVFSKYIRIDGVSPELLYIFVICTALTEKKPQRYITVGIVSGLVTDAFCGTVGFYLLIYTCTVFAVVWLSELIYKDMFFMVIPFAAVFTFVENSIFYLLNGSGAMNYPTALKSIILPVVIYNAAAALIINFLLKKTAYARNRGTRRR